MTTFIQNLSDQLQKARDKQQWRTLREVIPTNAVQATVDGKRCWMFSSNDYLGLSMHPDILQRATDILQSHGLGAGASRLISGSTDWHQRLQRRLAQWKQRPQSLVFGTGYAANLSAIASIATAKDIVIIDKLCHASLIDAVKLSGATWRSFPHLNYDKLRELLKKYDSSEKKIIVTDAVFSMDGDCANLKELVAIKKEFDAVLMVDDAHGTGVFGPACGSGWEEQQEVAQDIDISVGTLSKALGAFGGFIVAQETIIEHFINYARPFIFSTALPAAVAGAAEKAIELIETQPALRATLWKNVHQLNEGLMMLKLIEQPSLSPIIPIIVGESEKAVVLSRFLQDHQCFVPAIRPPAVGLGQARLRISLSAKHSPEMCAHLLNVLETAKQKGLV